MNVEALPISPQELGESPVWHPLEKALYWVDIAQRRLHRWDWEAASHREVPIWDEPGCIAPLRGGGVVVATRTGIIRMDDDLRRSWKITDAPYDTRIQRFNDGKVSPGGDLFLGTVHEPRDHPDACLYHLGPQGLAKVWGQCTVSNGLAWSADGSVMYWSDTWNHVIFRIVIGANQLSGIQPSVWRKFASKEQTSQALPYGGRPDGGAVDSQGCYWSAMFEGRRLLRIPDPAFSSGMSSKQESEYLLPVMCPTMPCFAGPLLDTLVITTARHQRSDDELRATPLAGCVLLMRAPAPGSCPPLLDPATLPIS